LLANKSKGFFLGPYKILDQLGQGGMGRIYKALHLTMNRTVALKVLAPHLVKTTRARELFKRELQATAQLNHPNIATAYDANDVNGRHYLAMEFIDGPNLEQLVREQGPLPPGMACEIIRQAANGLDHAAEREMIHRDIKPANLLLQPSKNSQSFLVKILDFGLARLNDNGLQKSSGTILVKENTVMGTPDFLSPEQARDLHKVDHRSDLYSLGATFYFLLTGKVPFPGGTTMEKLVRHGSEEPRPLTDFRQDVPPEVQGIIRRLMAKNPDDRYQSAQEAARALTAYAVAAAPPWDSSARRLPGAMNTSTPIPQSIDPAGQTPNSDMTGTLSTGMSPTPLSNSGEGQFLPWTDPELESYHYRRKALLWAVGIMGAVVGSLIGAFIFLNW
jgi:serine/threonine protein kinase